jgi:heme-degrading monooxygenase HmoA
MIVQMLVIVEMRDRYALAECLEAYTERVGPLLGKTQGLHAAYLAGEEGESTLAIVTLFWTNREAAIAWLNSGGDKTLQGTLRPYSLGEVILKFFRVEHEQETVQRNLFN